MRLRKRHAWGAVLIGLFALPVLRPDGFPSVERPGATFLGWFARTPVLNPRLWRSSGAERGDDSPTVRALEQDRALQYEEFLRRIALREGLTDLARAFAERLTEESLQESGLDRLPSVRSARVLRTTDPSGYRQSLLIDRGAEDGVREGFAVTYGNVLLGRAKVVHGRSTLVQLVGDPDSRLEVAVRSVKGKRVRGYLHGAPPGLSEKRDLDVRLLDVNGDTGMIEVDEFVFTSNADDRVPAGLLVGTVTMVSDPDVDRAPVLRIHPAFDLDEVLDVFVVIPVAYDEASGRTAALSGAWGR